MTALDPAVCHRAGPFIDGRVVPAHTAARIELVSPSTEEVIGSVPDSSVEDVDAAVASARRAFADPDGWRAWVSAERAAAMERLADVLATRDPDLAVLLAHEIGRPLGVSASRSSRASELLRYYAALGRSLVYEEITEVPERRPATSVRRSIVRREPRGVTAAIVPYNGTLMMGMYKVGPTLALGGTVVLKPAPQAPLEAYLPAEAATEVGIPDIGRGWYLEPTVFADARNDMRVCREEIFGPVVTIIPVADEHRAVAVANHSDFGLAGSVWSADEARAVAVAGRLDTGTVGINGFGFNTAAPFEGRRHSGLGVELGAEGFAANYQHKTLHLIG